MIPSIADMAPLMLIPTMRIELVVAVEALSTEATLGMTLESALIDRPRIIVTELFVLAKFTDSEELMLMGENLLVSRTKVAHDLVVHALDMSMQIWPAKTGNVTILIWAIVPKQENSILVDIAFFILDPQRVFLLHKVRIVEFLVSFGGVVCKNNKLRLCLARTSLSVL